MLCDSEKIMNEQSNLHGLIEVSLDISQKKDSNHNLIIFDCSLRNIGLVDIALGNTFLFLDQGIYDDKSNSYMFPFLQKKFLNLPNIANEDCAMSDNCKKGYSLYPRNIEHIDEFFSKHNAENLHTNCFDLPHLSSNSVLYMAPKEKFNEMIIVQLPKGVYRAILVSTPKTHTCDCMCKNICFIV